MLTLVIGPFVAVLLTLVRSVRVLLWPVLLLSFDQAHPRCQVTRLAEFIVTFLHLGCVVE